MHPHERAGIPSLGSTARIHINPIDGYQCSNELRAQLNLTNDQKRRRTTPKACPETSTWNHVMMQLVCQVLEQR
jgi:hypothetical protein